MNDLIKIDINYDSADRPTVLGRDLYRELHVKTRYNDWFDRMCEYGFIENKDYVCYSNLSSENQRGGQNKIDHQLTIPMAKELCMLQRTDRGKEIRQYFIAVEEQWNSPDAIMARALQLSNVKLKQLETHCLNLETAVEEMRPKAGYYDVVLNSNSLFAISAVADNYGWSARKMNEYLRGKGVQYKQGKMWHLYAEYKDKGYTGTKTHPINGVEMTSKNMYWTEKGCKFIYELLKSDGILPVTESLNV